MAKRHDYKIDGKFYAAYLGRGALMGQVAESPATPFAQRTTEGEPTLADSLTLSYFGMDSFHGGRGQDKIRSPYAFMDSESLVSFIRDQAIPGPKPHTFLAGEGVEHKPGNVQALVPTKQGYAESFVCPAGGLAVTRLQFYLRKGNIVQDPEPTIYFRLYTNAAGLPNSLLASATITWSDVKRAWNWVKGTISQQGLAGGVTYWAAIEGTSWTGDVVRIARDASAGYSGNVAEKSGGVWEAGSGYDLYFKINNGQQVDRACSGAIEFYGSQVVVDHEKEASNLEYTTEDADKTFTDDAQDFTDWQTTSGNAGFLIQVRNDDNTVSWGYLGAKVSNTEIRVYTNLARTTSGWKGQDPDGKTPKSYDVKNTTQIPPTLFFAMGKKLYYRDEVAAAGYATGGTATTLKDQKASFGTDTFNTGYTLYIEAGLGAGQSRDIIDTSEMELTVAPAWDTVPERGSRYVVRKDNPALVVSKSNFTFDITDMEVFKDWLYVAQGDFAGGMMYRLNGLTPSSEWKELKGVRAEHLCVHINADGDAALWRSRGHLIDCSTDGKEYGDTIEVGDRNKSITGMRVYVGEFIVFKEDGWYVIDMELWQAERILDFRSQPEPDAFRANCEYAGEVYAGKGTGCWRYTPGPDITPVGLDRGAVGVDLWSWAPTPKPPTAVVSDWDKDAGWGVPEIRLGRIAGLVGLTNFMYAAMDAGDEENRWSAIYVYNRIGWCEVIRAEDKNKPIRMIHFSPDISPVPRLWWSEGKAIKYANICDLGDNPYLWEFSEYIEEAELETSRYDAGREAHRKTLIVLDVQSDDLREGNREIEVYYEADHTGLWTYWGTITKSPHQRIYMAASNIGANKTVASGSTKRVIKVDSTASMVAEKWVRIGVEHRQVKTIDSATQFTVALPFSEAPAAGAVVYGGWPVVHEVALLFHGTTDDKTMGWALKGFTVGWLPRPPREWKRQILVEISDDAVEGRSAKDTWEDLMALADRPEPVEYVDYWGEEHDVFIMEPQFAPQSLATDAIDHQVSLGYAIISMIDVKLQ